MKSVVVFGCRPLHTERECVESDNMSCSVSLRYRRGDILIETMAGVVTEKRSDLEREPAICGRSAVVMYDGSGDNCRGFWVAIGMANAVSKRLQAA